MLLNGPCIATIKDHAYMIMKITIDSRIIVNI